MKTPINWHQYFTFFATWEHLHWSSIRNRFTAFAIPHDDLDPADYPPS